MKTIVGENLKRFRDASEYTQDEVATYIGIVRGAYANYETGAREMPYDMLLKVCELYGIALSSLFEEDVKKIEDDLVCAFRVKDPNIGDIKEISHFKNVVRNYLKMCSYHNE